MRLTSPLLLLLLAGCYNDHRTGCYGQSVETDHDPTCSGVSKLN